MQRIACATKTSTTTTIVLRSRRDFKVKRSVVLCDKKGQHLKEILFRLFRWEQQRRINTLSNFFLFIIQLVCLS